MQITFCAFPATPEGGTLPKVNQLFQRLERRVRVSLFAVAKLHRSKTALSPCRKTENAAILALVFLYFSNL
jgi:hypothetical protein